MTSKNFFEKYQTFFSIIIAGALVTGGIILAKSSPASSPSPERMQTESSVKKELLKTALSLSIPSQPLTTCLDENRYEQKIEQAMQLADTTGVTGTPTFVIIKGTKQWGIVGARDKETILKSIAEEKSPEDQPIPQLKPVLLTPADHYLGPHDASVIIVEYSDIDCPFCKRAKPVIEEILRENPDFAYVYRHSPILSLHPFAGYKAEATECVAELSGEETFWKFLDIISA